MKIEEKQVYEVCILKRGGDYIVALETLKFDEAHNLWVELKTQWTSALKESVPFELNKPIITAFDPGLIYEITVRPIAVETAQNNNPYQREMIAKGLGATLNTSRGQVFDGGYK